MTEPYNPIEQMFKDNGVSVKFVDCTSEEIQPIQKKPKRKKPVLIEDGICIHDIVPTLKFMENYNQFKTPIQWTKITNEAYDKSIIVGAKQKRMGKKAGTADYWIGWSGGWGWIEVKAPKGKQSESQVAFEREALDAGGRYVVVHNGDELRAALKEWGILK